MNVKHIIIQTQSRAREEELLQSAEVGDLIRVKRICDNDVAVDIRCTDPLGRTPLHLAVANEQKEVGWVGWVRADTILRWQCPIWRMISYIPFVPWIIVIGKCMELKMATTVELFIYFFLNCKAVFTLSVDHLIWFQWIAITVGTHVGMN